MYSMQLALAVFPKSAKMVKPPQRAFNHPSFGKHHKGVQLVAFHDFHLGVQQRHHRSGEMIPRVAHCQEVKADKK